MKRFGILVVGLVAAPALASSSPVPTTIATEAQSLASDAPAAITTLTWSSQVGQGDWKWTTRTAAGWTESGFTDWRLPTIAEAQAGVAAGVYGVPGSSNASFWTSEHQGNWCFTVNLNGQVNRAFWNGVLYSRFVRP